MNTIPEEEPEPNLVALRLPVAVAAALESPSSGVLFTFVVVNLFDQSQPLG
jgi:hypothetical protein